MADDSLPKSFTEAKRLNAPHYFTGKSCKNGHVALRDRCGRCVECLPAMRDAYAGTKREKDHEWYMRNASEVRERVRKWAKENPEKVRAYAAASRAKPKDAEAIERNREARRKYNEKNADRIRERNARWWRDNAEYAAERFQRYYMANKELYKEATRRRQAAKIQRTPCWLTKDHMLEMRELYSEAARLSEETGIKHEVDHIVPLQGRAVSGLHVPWNMRIVTRHENRTKHNRHVELQD